MPRTDTVYRGLQGRIDKETEKALLFTPINRQTGKEAEQVWFPRSQLSSFGGTYSEVDGTFNYILASEWILGQKSLLSSSIPRDLIKIVPKAPVVSEPAMIEDTGEHKEMDADEFWAQFGDN